MTESMGIATNAQWIPIPRPKAPAALRVARFAQITQIILSAFTVQAGTAVLRIRPAAKSVLWVQQINMILSLMTEWLQQAAISAHGEPMHQKQDLNNATFAQVANILHTMGPRHVNHVLLDPNL